MSTPSIAWIALKPLTETFNAKWHNMQAFFSNSKHTLNFVPSKFFVEPRSACFCKYCADHPLQSENIDQNFVCAVHASQSDLFGGAVFPQFSTRAVAGPAIQIHSFDSNIPASLHPPFVKILLPESLPGRHPFDPSSVPEEIQIRLTSRKESQ